MSLYSQARDLTWNEANALFSAAIAQHKALCFASIVNPVSHGVSITGIWIAGASLSCADMVNVQHAQISPLCKGCGEDNLQHAQQVDVELQA